MGKFSDSPYFLLENFFDSINETTPIEKPILDFKWLVRFVSSIDNGDGTRSFVDDQYTFNNSGSSSSNVIFTNYRMNMWNRQEYYDPNIVETFNSYIVAPMINITTKGGGLLDLFVKDDDIGFEPITVRYEGRNGNEFDFTNPDINKYGPGSNIIDILTGRRYMFTFWDKVLQDTFGLFENNREAYFRKDSLYHDWLRTDAKSFMLAELGVDFDIRNYVNTDKIFSYFQNIFKSHDNQECRIIFDGMKDYVLRAVPEHQRTPRFTELCNIFFDQLYQEIYDLLKNIWSLIDPMEVDQRYLGYLSRYYDMFDVDVSGATLLHVREFVRDMIWMIKRKGTYTEFYILWRILTATKNMLNVYERWHRKDVERFPLWPSTISPSCTGSWPHFPYFSDTNETTTVPTSAWVDVLYVYRDEYMAPDIDKGAGPGWYNKWYPKMYNTDYVAPSGIHCPPGSFLPTPLAPSGDNLMLSSHYILETDITSAPMTKNEIFSKDVWDSMYKYWEYIRPVNRVSNYRILIAPISDMSGKYVQLYNVTSQSSAFLKTKSYVSLGLAEGAYVYQQKTPASVWNISHNLGDGILLQAFDSNLNEVVPADITYGASTAKLTFQVPGSGFAIMRRASWVSTRPSPVLTETWRINHLRQQKEVIIHYNFENVEFHAQNTTLTNINYADATFQNIEQDTAVVGSGNFIFMQTTPEQIWDIPHNLAMKGVIMSVYTFDDVRVHPKMYTLVDSERCRLEFDSPTSGYVVLISVGGLSIEDILEELENNIKHPTFIAYTYDTNGHRIIVENGNYVKTYRDSDYYYFDLNLNKQLSYIVKEIDVFDDRGDILFNSKMSDLYKPSGVDLTFHYRLVI